MIFRTLRVNQKAFPFMRHSCSWKGEKPEVWLTSIFFTQLYWGLCMCVLSCIWLFAIPWIVAYQAPLSIGFSKQEHCSGLPFPSPGNLHDPGIKPRSLAFAGWFFTTEPPGKPQVYSTVLLMVVTMQTFGYHWSVGSGCPANWLWGKKWESGGSASGLVLGKQERHLWF